MRLLLGIVTVTGLIVAIAAFFLNRSATDVVVVNRGGTTVKVRGALPAGVDSVLTAVGVSNLPDEFKPDVPTVVRVPALSAEVFAATGGISVTMLGQTLHLTTACDNLEFDGTTLLGRRTTVDLGRRAHHDLAFACR